MVYLDRISTPAEGTTPRKLVEDTPYGITYVKALEVSDANSGSIKVCVVDSGYDLDHPDLPEGDMVTGESFVSGYEWFTDEGDHGTHVTGTIAALGGNDQGVKGVIRNGNLKLHIAKVFPASGSASWSTVIAGFQSCVSNGANVVNMSLGGSSTSSSFQGAINDAYNQGMLIFASSGNSYSSGYNYPASLDNVISVASIDSSYSRSSFSTFNDKVDIAAPGSNVLSTIGGGGYAYYSGTSMACPHAAGVAALVWSNYPGLPHTLLEEILESTAEDLPQNSNDGYDVEYGHGLINAKAAFDEVPIRLAPTVSPAPSSSLAPSSTPSDPFCVDGGIDVIVEVFTDRYYAETSWDIQDASGTVVASGGGPGKYTDWYTLYTHRFCLDKTEACGGVDYSFTIYDAFGDGICCSWGSGYYNVYVGGELKASGGEFLFSETTPICKCFENTTRKVCNGTFGCAWTKDSEGVGSCVATADNCDKTKKRKPCLEIDGCFWKTTGEGTGRCKVCSALTKKNACQDQGCTWEDNMCK